MFKLESYMPLESRLDYVKYDAESVALQTEFKNAVMTALRLAAKLEYSEEWRDAYIRYLELAYMASGKGIRDIQMIKRGATLQEERNDE